jgi:hypothetical protein
MLLQRQLINDTTSRGNHMKTTTTQKTVRVFGANNAKVRIPVPAVAAPRGIVGAVSCCCKDN